MSSQTVHLDLAMLTADQQVSRLKEQYVSLCGKAAVARAPSCGLWFKETQYLRKDSRASLFHLSDGDF